MAESERVEFALVPCPTCRAGEGEVCKRPSGHSAWPPHAKRIYATEWALEQAGMPRGYYEFVGRTRLGLAQSIGEHETVSHGR